MPRSGRCQRINASAPVGRPLAFFYQSHPVALFATQYCHPPFSFAAHSLQHGAICNLYVLFVSCHFALPFFSVPNHFKMVQTNTFGRHIFRKWLNNNSSRLASSNVAADRFAFSISPLRLSIKKATGESS